MAQRTIELVPILNGGVRQGHLRPVITDCAYTDLDELWIQDGTDGIIIDVDHPELGATRSYRLAFYASGQPSGAVAIALHSNWYWVPTGSGVVNSIIATANRTLSAGESGSIISNAGAAGAVTLTLPPAIPGLRYKFLVEAAQQLRIDPSGTETAALPSTGVQAAAGKYIWADALTEWVEYYCNTAGTWDCLGYSGTWTAEV